MFRSILVAIELLGFTLLVGVFAPPFWAFLGKSLFAQLGVWVLYGIAALILGVALNRFERGEGFRAMGLRYHRGFRADVRAGVIAYAVSCVVTLPIDAAALAGRAAQSGSLIRQLGLSSLPQVLVAGGLLALIAGFLTGAFHEEIRFRGYYQGVTSREVSPLAGFLAALIPFSLGHHFAHPDWSAAQVLATVVPGAVFGILYHATGSLVAVMTTHTLTNWIGAYPALVLAGTGNRTAALFALFGLGAVCAVLVVAARNREVRMLWEAGVKMFCDRTRTGLISGVLIGGALLAIWPLRSPGISGGVAGACLLGLAVALRKTAGGGRSQ